MCKKLVHSLPRIVTLLLLVVVMLIPARQSVFASTYTVNDSGDAGDSNPGNNVCATSSGKCTLRAAIDEANSHPGVDTITIPAMTIVINSELRIVYGSDLSDDKGVIIKGAGMNNTIIDGNNKVRVFYFGRYTSTKHAISDLTIRNGNNQVKDPQYNRDNNGGGIFNESAGLTLTNVKITGSKANQGGGLYSHFAYPDDSRPSVPRVVLNNVWIMDNTAFTTDAGLGNGGGIMNGSLLEGNKVYLKNNTATFQGGGLFINTKQPVNITDFEITGNTAVLGGGVFVDLAATSLEPFDPNTLIATFTNGKINNNTVTCCSPYNAHASGGGIANNMGVVKLVKVQVASNKNTDIGGSAGGVGNFTMMELVDVSVTGNQASYGAGVYNGNNDQRRYGVPVQNRLKMTNTTISSNYGLNGSNPTLDSAGGGIFNLGNLISINSTITKNTARNGGGMMYRMPTTYGTPSLDMYNTIMAGNNAPYGPSCMTSGASFTSHGYNIFGPLTNCSATLGTGDQTNKDPMVNDFSGWPAIHTLKQGSPAINKGTNSGCPATDARGIKRPVGGTCDVGAVEFLPYQVYLPTARR